VNSLALLFCISKSPYYNFLIIFYQTSSFVLFTLFIFIVHIKESRIEEEREEKYEKK
jgi:hypothetical protein